MRVVMPPSNSLLKLLIVVLLIFCGSPVFSQGIKGTVFSMDGDPLAYASIYVRNLNDGIPANLEGYYEMKLSPGHYDVIVQHVGHQSVQRTVEVQNDWITLNFTLEPQTYALQEVEVKSDAEDPALTIMRRAISKANYHSLQVQEYRMTVYIKGTGELTDAPFFMKKRLKEEGIGLNEAFTSESLSEITFSQPNTLEEKVVSVRSTGEQNQTSPAPYIGASFYDDQINEAVSPLSRSAFAYYRFRFEGSFFEDDVLINKIRVTPRSRGERVFEGFIYIIDELWAIHSLDLKTSLLGFNIEVKQQYAPVAEQVWMPITHVYTFAGSFFGFAGEYKYLASTRDYDITLNPDLVTNTTILDETVEHIPAEVKNYDKKAPAVNQIADEGKMSRKGFRKMINQYEKETLKERKDAEVVSERTYMIDSLASKRSLSYWDSIRPVKLTNPEIKGYQRDDSLMRVEAARNSGIDSIAKKAKRKFNSLDIIKGGRYHFGKGRSAGLDINLIKISYNTVEGFNIGFSGFYDTEKTIKMDDSAQQEIRSWNFRPELRYGLASRQPYATLKIRREIAWDKKSYSWGAAGGKYVYQYNRNNPIHEQVNAFYSLVFKENYMKLFEQSFAKIYWEHMPAGALSYKIDLEYAHRNQLVNQAGYSLFETSRRTFTSNQPVNAEAQEDAFQDHNALLLSTTLFWRPGLKYSIRNGNRYPLMESAPLIQFNYNRGAPLNAHGAKNANFDQLELTVSHKVAFGVSGQLHFNISAGSFVNNDQVYFMDYKHFGGTRTIFTDLGAANSYRFLDYYQYSTKGDYFSSILHYQFRKFLITQSPLLRFSGLRENIFINYIKTKYSPHYTEIGYSLDNVFRLFRVEIGAGFEKGNYSKGGMRFGIATFINFDIGE